MGDDTRMFSQDVFDISCVKDLGSLFVALIEVGIGACAQCVQQDISSTTMYRNMQ